MEQRLIDANELYDIESLLNTDIVQNSPEASWLMSQVLHDIQASPTIDPETMPVVRQLREELARVTAERDAAVEQLHGYCFACKHYTPYHNDGLCATCKHERARFKPWDAVDRWQWRGPQKKG